MSAPIRPDLLAALPDLVAERIAAVLPALKTCRGMTGGFDLEELKRQQIAAPAVLVSRLAVTLRPTPSGPRRLWTVAMAAFVVTRDTAGLKRDTAAAAITQALLELVPDANWGEPGLGPAERVEARVLVGQGAREITAHLSAVTWDQPVTFGPSLTTAPLPIELYVGGEPL
jgi:hypothetical protein